jgi:two-component system OmpR family sensor kinase
VAEGFWPAGLRGRLVAAIVLVAIAVLGASFYVLHERTGADLEGRIDDQLRGDLAEFEASPAARATTPAQLRVTSRAFVNGQGYHPDSRIFAIEIGDGPAVVTNSEELFEAEAGTTEADEHGAPTNPSQLFTAPAGFDTVSAGGEARVRVLTQPLVSEGRRIGTFRVAESLGQVSTAQDSLRSALLVVGALALALLVGAAFWIATLVARPLKRIAAFAADIDTAGLDRRLANDRGPTEVRSLTDSLNHMLDRLQGAFEREREFVADASHELRTPITIAEGELELLRREVGPAERERLDVVHRELRRMERLISEMLTLAREDAGRSLELRRVEVPDVLDDLRRDLPLLGPRDYSVSRLAGTLEADPDRLAQVVRNLVANAVAHTSEGGRVEVRTVADGSRLRFEVGDDGPGIPPDEAAHLFERFYRSPESRARDADGSGLGLAIARAIVEAHGGRIWAEPGPGGLVAFEIPGYRPPAGDGRP